jgi:guanylate kinase
LPLDRLRVVSEVEPLTVLSSTLRLRPEGSLPKEGERSKISSTSSRGESLSKGFSVISIKEPELKDKGLMVVISSPSGGGKTTICQGVLKRNMEYVFSVSVTTRKRRGKEIEGRDYCFISERQFKAKVKKGELAEWAYVHNHYYGTLKRFVDLARKHKKTVLFDVDINGGTTLKRRHPDSILIFLLPPSIRELKRRLVHREKDDSDEVERRMRVALKEIRFVSKYDYVVINRKIKDSIQAVEEIINSERRKTARVDLKNLIKKM